MKPLLCIFVALWLAAVASQEFAAKQGPVGPTGATGPTGPLADSGRPPVGNGTVDRPLISDFGWFMIACMAIACVAIWADVQKTRAIYGAKTD